MVECCGLEVAKPLHSTTIARFLVHIRLNGNEPHDVANIMA